MFRKSNNSLRLLTKRTIKETNGDLYKIRREIQRQWRINTITAAKSFWICISFVAFLSLFIGCFSNPLFIKFTIDDATKWIDGRLSNIVTITSITLAVAAVIINNIAQKSKENYAALFRLSYLFPIIYYTLSVIGLYIIISFFKEVLGADRLANLTLLLLLLTLPILFFIGFLFSMVVKITNHSYLQTAIHKDNISQAKYVLYLERVHYSSKKILTETIAKHGKIVDNAYYAKNKVVISRECIKDQSIYDVRINDLSKTLGHIHKASPGTEIEFIPFGISQLVPRRAPLKFVFMPLNHSQINSVQIAVDDYVQMGSKDLNISSFSDIRDNILDKTKEAIKTGNRETMGYSLKFYESIYDLYLENFGNDK